MKNILIRCDSSSTIGSKHVKRCLLLAKRLKKENSNLKILFATLPLHGNINQEILKSGFSIYSLNGNSIKDLDYIIKGLSIDFLIIDTMDINDFFEEQIKLMNPNLKMLSFDDEFKVHKSDYILNGAIYAKKSDYKNLVLKKSKILCGSECTLLEKDFLKRYKKKIEKKSVGIILDENSNLELSTKLKNYLLEIDEEYKITLFNPNDTKNLAEELAIKEFIICSSDETLFDVLALKKKFINIETSDEQKNIINYLEEKNLKTTIKADNITIKKLEKKIEYIKKKYIYRKLDLEFSKDKLVDKILKEFK